MAFKYLLPQKVQMRLYVRLGDVLDWTILPSTAEGSDGGGGGCRGVMDRSLNICKGGGGRPGGERIDCANLRVWFRKNIREAHYMLTRNTKAKQNTGGNTGANLLNLK